MTQIYAADEKSANGYTPLNPTGLYTTDDAVAVCKLIEPVVAKVGYHVGLTGGCLYGQGGRKDIDLLFYRIRNKNDFEKTKNKRFSPCGPEYKYSPKDLVQALADELGIALSNDYGFVKKLVYSDLTLDAMFPDREPNENEDYPKEEDSK